jgi:hypothetical protein
LRVDAGFKALRITLCLVLILREEQHAYRKWLARTQEKPGLAEKKITRNGSLNANAVATLAVGGDRAAMRKAAQRRQCESKDFVLGTAVQGRNESDPAGFMVKAGIYEALTTRRKLATTHSPLYMERAVQMKKNFVREKTRAINYLRPLLWQSNWGWLTGGDGNVKDG